MDIQYINAIIHKSVTQTLSSEEEKELAHWISTDTDNEEYYAKVKAIHTLDALRRESEKDDVFAKELRVKMRRRSLRLYSIRYGAAVVILLMVALGGFLYKNGSGGREAKETTVAEAVKMESGLVIKRNNERINLVPGRTDDSGCVIDETRKEIILKGIDTIRNEEVTIFVDRGHQYKVTLPDSTKVWLNSESELRYIDFGNKRREVTLKGEACFDVVKDKLRPFVVHLSSERSVTVLGTFFSVKAYEEDANTKVSLIEGSVNVKNGKENLLLTPNKEVIIDHESNETIIQDFDSRKIRIWMTGGVAYYNEELEDIVKDMSRRYNREFMFENEMVKKERLTVVLDSILFDDIINHIRRAGKGLFTVEQKDNRIVFKEK